ncbi:MAG: hypothetical protein AAF989_16315 [Planctomycetota bacterium]
MNQPEKPPSPDSSTEEEQIVSGIMLDDQGQAIIRRDMQEVLLDLSLALEDQTGMPVDVQHVVASLVLAVRDEKLRRDAELHGSDQDLINILCPLAKQIFQDHGDLLG